MAWDDLSPEEQEGHDGGRAYRRAMDRQIALMGGGNYAYRRYDSFYAGATDHEVSEMDAAYAGVDPSAGGLADGAADGGVGDGGGGDGGAGQ